MNVGVLVNLESEGTHMFTSDLQPWPAREEAQDTAVQVVLYMGAALAGVVWVASCVVVCVCARTSLGHTRSLTTGQNCQGKQQPQLWDWGAGTSWVSDCTWLCCSSGKEESSLSVQHSLTRCF